MKGVVMVVEYIESTMRVRKAGAGAARWKESKPRRNDQSTARKVERPAR